MFHHNAWFCREWGDEGGSKGRGGRGGLQCSVWCSAIVVSQEIIFAPLARLEVRGEPQVRSFRGKQVVVINMQIHVQSAEKVGPSSKKLRSLDEIDDWINKRTKLLVRAQSNAHCASSYTV